MGEGRKESKAGAGGHHAYLLKYWARTRGPLFERTRMAVVRAVVCGELLGLSRAASERSVRMSASRTLKAHQGPGEPAKDSASAEALEAAMEGCAGLRRIARNAAHLPFWRQTDEIVELLRGCETGGRDQYDELMDYCWAELLCGVLFAREDAIRLRAARTLLCWTEPDARKMGRGNPRDIDGEAREAIAQVRATGNPGEPPPRFPHNPPAECRPEIQARGRDSP